MDIKALGFDSWFENHLAGSQIEKSCFARISAVDRGAYRIIAEPGDIPAELSGRLLYQADSPVELPCIGDWVAVSLINDNTAAIIHEVLPRKTVLRRKTPGERMDFQMIGANIDTAFIVQSCHFDFNVRRLERYLATVMDGGVTPVVVLTKTDLVSLEDVAQKKEIASAASGAEVMTLSNVTGQGLEAFKKMLQPGKTACLLGSSGVGKSTLINRLAGKEFLDTAAVSGTGEGTHTTTRRQLIRLDWGALLIDTPGMRELGMAGSGQGIAQEFDELTLLSENCRYADCSHSGEPGCAVMEAIEQGTLSEERLASYIKLKKEADHYDMSYREKRKKEKALSRHVKAFKRFKKEKTGSAKNRL